jgi:hypothetical protein
VKMKVASMSIILYFIYDQIYQKIIKLILSSKFVTQSRTGLQIYEGHGDQLNRPGPMA